MHSCGRLRRSVGAAAVSLGMVVGLLLGWGVPTTAVAGALSMPVAGVHTTRATPGARRRLAAWHALIQADSRASERVKLERVNAFFNRLRYISDRAAGRGADEWATPREFLLRDAGDCEDYALAKYFTLRDIGVSRRRLRLMYVRTLPRRKAHMILVYRSVAHDGKVLVLDNLRSDIVPLSRRPDLLPVYSFNGSGLWLAARQGGGRRVGSADRLSRWRDLLHRLRHLPGGAVY